MSVQELALPMAFRSLHWSPTGEFIALTAEAGSLWRVDYPNLSNLEQLTPALPDTHDVTWSPDGTSVAFISGADIYIVDTMK
jgi:Tol biopolymer transport system component